MKPDVLILDEPTAGLDPAGRDEILGLVSDMHKNLGITIILVSHSMEDVAEYVERIIVMNQGEVMYDAPPKDVYAHYKELEAVGLAAPQVTYLMHDPGQPWTCRGHKCNNRKGSCKVNRRSFTSIIRRKYVKRYHSGSVLSGRFCRT